MPAKKNKYLKPANYEHEFTYDQIEEMQKCYADPVYFIKNYVKIVHATKGIIPFELYSYQENMIRAFHEEQYTIVLSARQTGKCVSGDTEVTVVDTRKMPWYKKAILWVVDRTTYDHVFQS